MQSRYVLNNVDDALLIERLKTLVAKNNEWTAVLLAHLAEVDARKLYLPSACSSMFDYCISVLKLSEGSAFKRIHAARAARKFPMIFELVAGGAVHLSGITVLATHLTEENHAELLAKATHKSKRSIEELVAAIAPKPDAPAAIRKMPAPKTTPPLLAIAARSVPPQPTQNATPPPKAPPPEPLSEDRFKVQFTASRELRDKIGSAQALMRHQVPDGDLARVFDKAIDLLLAELNRKKFAATNKPKTSPTKPAAKTRTRHIPAEIQRPVVERDGLRCTFVGANGRRCESRAFLELHHEHPFGKGGAHSVDNVRVLCRAHNAHLAEKDYGADFIQRKLALSPGNVRATVQVDST